MKGLSIMKTAEEIAQELNELKYTHNFDLSNVEKIDNAIYISTIEAIQLDAYKQGMTDAEKTLDDVLIDMDLKQVRIVEDCKKMILAARDNKTTL